MLSKSTIKLLMGLNLIRLRTAAKMTGVDLAVAIGSAPSTITKAEQGQVFGDDLLSRLCNCFKVSPTQFFLPVEGGKITDMNAYSFTVCGGEMSPRYPDGCVVYADKTATVQNGDYVVVAMKNIRMVRRAYYFPPHLVLVALDQKTPPLLINESEVNEIHKITGSAE